MSSQKTDPHAYDERCSRLLAEDDIRFAGVIDVEGNLIGGGFKKTITPLEGDPERLRSFMKFISKITISKDYDENLGNINYIAVRRDRAVLVSFPFPVTRVLLLVSAEPTVDIEKMAARIVEIFSGMS